MTGWLASVANDVEIARILPAAPDILDLKDPAAGALGAWPVEHIAATVRDLTLLPGRPRLSATIGDHPMKPDIVLPAVRRVAETGVDFVKIGFAPEGAPDRCIDALAPLTATGSRLIAVLFADLWPTDPGCLPIDRIAAAGFAGAMLDTAGKRHGLRHHWPDAQLAAFVTCTRSLGLLTGLAGSLRVADIPALLALSPDYLGFRGALCGGERTADINPQAVSRVAARMAGRPIPDPPIAALTPCPTENGPATGR
ncbi:(5-formylfuran-3-yl)methyl phosphate synthase [Azospirillum sp. HJ39]|uniref:(5-formylfuran-3-yl)methyl phosphate synthase n=1 Tax=Azospirillum sp. HJ39 TaxID=3159496 RepID=UPI00355869A2